MSFIPVNEPFLGGNEKKYLNECIDTGWISSEGPFIKKFEEEFAIRQVERAIESGWTGVVFTGTERDYQEWLNLKYNGSNRKTDAKPDESSAGIQSIVFGK